MRGLIESCLDVDPVTRPGFSEIVKMIDDLNFDLIEDADTEEAYEYFEEIVAI